MSHRIGTEFNPHCLVIGEPEIGPQCWIGYFTVLDGSGGLVIEEGVEVASGAQVLSHSTEWRCVNERRMVAGEVNREDIAHSPTRIERFSFIGANAVILRGVVVGHHSVIGAGAVVTTSIPPYSIAVGVPARVVGSSKTMTLEQAMATSAAHEC